MADTKISALTADASPTSDDLVVTVDIGTGANKKVTLANLGKGLTALPNVTDLTASGTISGNVTGNLTGQADTVATIAGLAPDTATTQATQPNITTCANLATVGTITSGVWNAGAVTSSGAVTGASLTDGTASLASGSLSSLVNLTMTGYQDITEMAAPGNPAANVGRLYVADDGGTTTLYFKDNAGTATNLLAGGGGSPGGADTQIQFNDGGSFNGDAAFTFTKATGDVALTSTATTTNALSITADSLTSGKGLYVYSNSADASARNLVEIRNANSAADNAKTLYIKQYGDVEALDVAWVGGSSGTGVRISEGGNSLITGTVTSISSGSRFISTGELFNTANTTSGALSAKTGSMNSFTSNRTNTRTSATIVDDFDNVLISRTSVQNGVGGTLAPAGSVLKLENIATQTAGTLADTTLALEIAHNTYAATDQYAIAITHDNGGAGAAGGIDLSSFSVDEPVFKFVADATDPTGGGEEATGRIAVDVAGSTVYLAYY